MLNPRWKEPATPQEPKPASGPNYCIVGDMLCEVRVWTEQEWSALKPEDRPVTVKLVPELGWVGAVPAGRG